MTPEDELRDALRYQALQAPEPLAVQARINRAVDRRRRRSQVLAVASATLAVGGLGLGVQALRPSSHHVVNTGGTPTTLPIVPSSRLPSPSGSGSPSASATVPPSRTPSPVPLTSRAVAGNSPAAPTGGTPNDAIDAFFAASYQYDDAVTLSQLWQTDAFTAKAIAGQILRDGGSLPVKPGQVRPTMSAGQTGLAAEDRDRFFAAGYSQSQAAELATLWQETDVELVTVVAGQQMADGVALPVAPG
jgi:hypothetical protein